MKNEGSMITLAKAQELMEIAAGRVADKLLRAFGIEGEMPATPSVAPQQTVDPDLQAALGTGDVSGYMPKMYRALLEADQTHLETARKAYPDQVKAVEDYRNTGGTTPAAGIAPAVTGAPTVAASEVKQEDSKVSSETSPQTKQEAKIMKVEVTAESKGTPNIPSGDSAHGGSKGEFPVVPGKVITEGPASDALPKGVKTEFALKTTHESESEKLAKQSDAEIEKLKRAKGQMTENGKLASVVEEVKVVASSAEGLRLVESFLAFAKKKSKKRKSSPAAQKYVDEKMATDDKGKEADKPADNKGFKAPSLK